MFLDYMEYEVLGLTKTEERVYIALLKEGSTLASSLIKRLQLHRATVYDVLERLVEKGMAGYVVINKKKHYEANSPEKFLEIINEKKKQLEDAEIKAIKVVKELSKIQKQTTSSNVKILSGKEGLKNLMVELLKVKEFLVLVGEVRFSEYLPIYTKHWAKERVKRKVYARILTNMVLDIKWKYNKYKKLPKGLSFPSSTLIFGKKIAIVLPEEPLKIIFIESKQSYDSYKSEFELLWNK